MIGEENGALFIETRRDAPNGCVLRLDEAGCKPVVAERAGEFLVIAHHATVSPFAVIADGKLFLTYMRDCAHRLKAFALEGAALDDIALPEEISVLGVAATDGGVEVVTTSYTHAPCGLADRPAHLVRDHDGRARTGARS